MRWAPLVIAGFAGAAIAAPDEDILGRREGYPICAQASAFEQRCLIGTYSHADRIFPARKVAKAAQARPFKRAEKEPDLAYAHQERGGNLESYLGRNRTTGLVLLKGDTVLVERYQYERTPEHRFGSASMAKTVVAMLIGIAIGEGRIKSVDDRADQYVPELKGTPYGETPLKHLLTMSSGVKFREDYDGKDDVATLARATMFLQGEGGSASVIPFKERVRAPGEQFYYASAETQVLGLVLRAATGKPLADYLSEKIWRPMGAEADATWLVDKSGYEIAYCCLNATLRDYARFGMLLANDGALDGRQIIPANWVRTATTVQAPHLAPGAVRPGMGYGYQTWLLRAGERRFALLGVRGQTILVDPKSKLVLVHTAVRAQPRDPGGAELFSMWNQGVGRLSD